MDVVLLYCLHFLKNRTRRYYKLSAGKDSYYRNMMHILKDMFCLRGISESYH